MKGFFNDRNPAESGRVQQSANSASDLRQSLQLQKVLRYFTLMKDFLAIKYSTHLWTDFLTGPIQHSLVLLLLLSTLKSDSFRTVAEFLFFERTCASSPYWTPTTNPHHGRSDSSPRAKTQYRVPRKESIFQERGLRPWTHCVLEQ